MSRIGKMPISVPSGVTVTLDGRTVTANGPKGSLTEKVLPGIDVKTEGETVVLTRQNEQQDVRGWHGLMRSLISNMVQGVSTGFSKQLEINGVGYRVALSGSDLRFSLGYSHPIVYKLPPGISASVEQNIITISGNSKQQVGQVAAEIRALRKPEPYKGKGIKYVGERINRKSGKSGKELKA